MTAVGANKVLIAARNDDTGATNAGAAYLFNLNGTLLVTFTNPAPATDDWFGYSVISVGADKVLISAVLDSSFGPNAGAAYLYSTNGTLLTTVTNPSPGQIVFGAGMAPVGSDKFIIAALLDSTNGVAYLFNTNGTRLATFGPALGLGFSMAWVRPDKVAINVPSGPGGASFVYLFNTNGTQLATFSNPSQPNNDLFAYTLAAVGDRVVVGAPQNSTGALESGIAYLFGANAAYVPGLISQGVLDGSITAASLGNFAIDSSKIADGTISTVDLADGSVIDDKIASVDGSKLTGIIQDARLSGNVAFLYANQTFTGQNTLNNPANVFAGDGNGLTNLNSSQLTSGTVGDARLSANVPRLNANQTFTGQNTLNNPANSFSGNGGGLTNLNALTLGGISSNGFWKTTGNAGTTPGVDFLGTTDNQPLSVKVNNKIALQFMPGTTLPNVVGGLAGARPSVIAPGVSGAVIAGGNAPSGDVTGGGGGDFQAVYDNDGTVGGGFGNKVGSNNGDITDGAFATVAGGVFNSAANYAATVCGGDGNFAGGQRSFVGGGYANQALANFSTAGGGYGNTASGPGAFVGGGGYDGAAVSGNIASGVAATISGGWGNSATDYATVGGGYSNIVSGIGAVVGGGGTEGVFLSGNLASGGAATISGGLGNRAINFYATIGGGGYNTASGTAAFVGAGSANTANGTYAMIPGGRLNSATNYSFAAGLRAKANFTGSFVWADSNDFDFSSTAANKVRFRCTGGFDIITGIDGFGNQNAGVFVAPGGSGWNTVSDRNAKESFQPVNGQDVLAKVAALPLTTWKYKSQADGTRHIGVMAQDFHAAFQVGEDERCINTVDADGVALAAIQGLNEKLEEQIKGKDAEIAELRSALAELTQLVRAQTSR